MTNTMTPEAAREIIGLHVQTIEIFANYLNDTGVQIYLTLAASRTLGISVTDAQTLLSGAGQDVAQGKDQSVVDGMIDGAASLTLLALIAREVRHDVLPPVFIPPTMVVEAALFLFHEKKFAPVPAS